MSESAQKNTDIDGKKRKGLLRSSSIVGSMTMLSRVFGLIRDIILANFIGAHASADAFFVAWKIPQFFRRLFAEGAFSQAFVPVLAEYRSKGNVESVRLLVRNVSGVLGAVLLLFTGLAVWGAPWLTTLFAPGFVDQADKFQLTVELIRITFPYLCLISMTGLAGAVLNSYDQFAVPAVTPVLLNLSLIFAALVAVPWFPHPAYALAWGVFVAGTIQFLFQLPFLARINMLMAPGLDVRHEGVTKVLKLMVPVLFGVSVSQINLLLDTVLASFLPNGSVSWLYYSDRLVELPLGVFAIAVATVILPSLSRDHAEQSQQRFSQTLDWALRMIALIAIPAALALIVMAQPILVTLFQYGELQARDVLMASYSLRAYAVGLLAFMWIKVLAPGYFARQDTKTPAVIGIKAMVANMGLNLLFVIPLHHYYQVGHVGLALATSVSAFLNAGLLFWGLLRLRVYQPQPGWAVLLLRLLLANGSMVAVLWLFAPDIELFQQWLWWQRAALTLSLCGAGFAVYGSILWLSGIRPRHLRAPT